MLKTNQKLTNSLELREEDKNGNNWSHLCSSPLSWFELLLAEFLQHTVRQCVKEKYIYINAALLLEVKKQLREMQNGHDI